jgi:hypothetical protein
MKFVFGDKTMDFTAEEVHNFMVQAQAHGIKMPGMEHEHSHHEEYWDRAKENITRLVDDEVNFPIETEADAKKILSHCLDLPPRKADLLYEIIEFAIGMRMVHAEK